MNERIFELAKRADLIQWDTLPSGARTPDHESVVKAKKFAELIVQSILDMLETEREYYANPSTYQFLEYYTKMSAKEDAINDAISMIRSKFGVAK